ncbi:GntR family transcriptional regulator [Agromyces bauzanensis]
MAGQRIIQADALAEATPPTPSLADQIYERLRDGVITAHWKPGTILLEPELATTFGVSKTPVREALRLLVQEGWVVILPRKGYMIRPLRIEDVSEVFGLRMMIEPGILGELAAETDDHAADELAQRLAAQVSAGDDVDASLAAARDFHLAAAQLSHNRRAEAIISGLLDEVKRLHHLLPNVTAHISSTVELGAHQAIVDAVRAHDSELAATLMRDHIAEVARTMVDGFTSLRTF